MQYIVKQQYLLFEALSKKIIHSHWIRISINVVFQNI